jgi:multicomponent Na+:H+ antiporter subunit E
VNLFLLNILLAIAWAALMGSFEPQQLLFGFVLGYLVMWLVSRMGRPSRYFKQLPLGIELLLFFLFDVLRANVRMAVTILSPRMRLRPAVVAVPLILKSEAAMILLANMLTLTPGTLSLDVSTDRQMLYVHTVWLDDTDEFRRQVVEGYEKRIKELFES